MTEAETAIAALHDAVAKTALTQFRNPTREYAEMLRSYAEVLKATNGTVNANPQELVLKIPDYRDVEFE